MAQRPPKRKIPNIKTNSRAYNAQWKERDEAVLVDLLNKKIHELRWDISEADSPYEREKLKAKRREYRDMLDKVERGMYNGNIIMAELAAAVQYDKAKAKKRETALSKYVSSYDDVDFDYESYFAKSRYYGVALPILIIICTVLFLGLITMTAFVPASVFVPMEDSLSDGLSGEDSPFWFSVTAVSHMKLDGTLSTDGKDTHVNDFIVANTGIWPKGKPKEVTLEYIDVLIRDASGEPITDKENNFVYKHIPNPDDEGLAVIPTGKFERIVPLLEGAGDATSRKLAVDVNGVPIKDGGEQCYSAELDIPAFVYLYEDVGLQSIEISAFDVMRGLFRTPFFAKWRVDPIEDLDVMSSESFFFRRYLEDRENQIKIEKDLDGNYDPVVIFRAVATYGTMISMWLAVIFGAVTLVMCLFRLFSHTSRKFHWISFLMLLFGALAFLFPAFLDIQSASFDGLKECLGSYFGSVANFLNSPMLLLGNIVFLGSLIFPLIVLILPGLMKNRRRENVVMVPKGNKRPSQELMRKPAEGAQGHGGAYGGAPNGYAQHHGASAQYGGPPHHPLPQQRPPVQAMQPIQQYRR